ncbi:MAG: ROK family protein [Armatimonadetes bacterium]|nr:ROK family protein [Armatimonadota bacterium]
MDARFIGIDLGNTNQTIALADASGNLLRIERRVTEPGGTAPAILEGVLDAVETLLAGQSARDAGVRAVGVGFGGPVDMPTGTVRLSHQVPGWEDVPLKALLEERFAVPARVDNDANVGTLGELRFGAGQGLQDIVYINIGTGIGGGLVFAGRLHRGVSTAAGEIGHTIVLPGGPLCSCGHRGCLEALCSGTAIGRRARDLAEGDPALGARLLTLAGGDPERITAKTAFRAAEEGDPGGRRVLNETVEYLAIAIGNLLNLLNPQAIILGGGVSEAGDLLFVPLRERTRDYCMEPPYAAARILPAQLGYDAGVRGAVALAMEG